MAKPNEYDSNGSFEIGLNAEHSFINCMSDNGISSTKANRYQETREHWDFRISNGDKNYRVEVKARKRKRRHGQIDDDIIYVELKNVAGFPGWVYGKADFLAFERPDGFLFVRRDKLAALTKKLCRDEWAERPTLYKKYRRESRPDECVTIITIDDVLSLPHKLYRFSK